MSRPGRFIKQSFTPPRSERRAWASIARSAKPTAAAIAQATHSAPADAVEIRKELLSNPNRRPAKLPPLRELAEATEEVRAEHGLPYCGGKRFKRALAYTDALATQGEGDGAEALAAAEADGE